jgi:UDP-N-acetylglucosamine:LPS N-acetylglucosamine transferase
MENGVKSGRLRDISSVARKSSSIAHENYELFKGQLSDFDMLIQDEFAETMFCFMWDKNPKLPASRTIITDYLQFESGNSLNPFTNLVTWYANRMLRKAFAKASLRIFADDISSVPSRLRKLLTQFEVVGPIVASPPAASKEQLRNKIIPVEFGTTEDSRKLIVVSVGGTSTGNFLIDFVSVNSQKISNALDCRIIVLLGPRIEKSEYMINKTESIQFVPFTTASIQYFKAADCVISQAGASTLNEVASLGVACVAIPLSNHFEQEANARRFSENFGFVALKYDELTIKSLVDSVKLALGKNYPAFDFSTGAERASQLIVERGICK